MNDKPDPLWDPEVAGDAGLARLETLLQGYRHVDADDQCWAAASFSKGRRRRHRSMLVAAAALAACVALLSVWLPWRLQWSEDRQWAVQTDAPSIADTLAVGQTLTTTDRQSALLRVARIGRMEVLPGTRVTLTETRAGHHRLELLDGRVRARIWAPPGYFGITAGSSETVDLGCEFEMTRNLKGAGHIDVINGWVMHSVNGQETLVPAGASLQFDNQRSGIPFMGSASRGLRAAVEKLDLSMADDSRLPDVEAAIARNATDADRITLLTLLTRYPALASGPLYPKLATMFGVTTPDEGHRLAWQQGSVHAMNLWWQQVPRPPKAWWLNWRDALG